MFAAPLALPAIAISGIFNHLSANKEIKEIKEKERKVLNVIYALREDILKFDLYLKRCEEVITSLEKSCEAMLVLFKDTKKKLFPLGFLSKLQRKIKSKSKKYTDDEYSLLFNLKESIQAVLTIVDAPILDSKDIIKKAKEIENEEADL